MQAFHERRGEIWREVVLCVCKRAREQTYKEVADFIFHA
jgi:phosphoribosyl-ATP pyrophosphohydrolase